jgi:hypothetical protein
MARIERESDGVEEKDGIHERQEHVDCVRRSDDSSMFLHDPSSRIVPSSFSCAHDSPSCAISSSSTAASSCVLRGKSGSAANRTLRPRERGGNMTARCDAYTRSESARLHDSEDHELSEA